jgi:hypothetical protein
MELNRWENFNKREQLLTIGAEFMRAKVWQEKDKDKFLSALERALELINITLRDAKWENNPQMILGLRDEVSKFYSLQRTDDVSFLYNVL